MRGSRWILVMEMVLILMLMERLRGSGDEGGFDFLLPGGLKAA
jgi:hypothetical protein